MSRKDEIEETIRDCIANLLRRAPLIEKVERVQIAKRYPGIENAAIVALEDGEILKVSVKLLDPEDPLSRALDDSLPPGEMRWIPRGKDEQEGGFTIDDLYALEDEETPGGKDE